jgi:cleavage and polyadenylation specificity factor subunit 1
VVFFNNLRRLATRKDTTALIIITLDLVNQNGTIIWSQWDLPFDCEQILPMLRPIGGVLVFSTNSLLHIDQVHSYGLAVNHYVQKSTEFPSNYQEALNIHLNECTATLISHDQCMIILESGEVYLARFLTDGRTVIKITMILVDEVDAKVTCAIHLNPWFIFLGSCLGDSVLYAIQNSEVAMSSLFNHKEPSKFKYLQECDRLNCFAPITDFAMGFCQEVSEELNQKNFCELELVASMGYRKTGGICVIHRQLRPDILYSYDVGPAKSIFALKTHLSQNDMRHTHLLISFQDHTVVLETKHELIEMDRNDSTYPFIWDRPTVLAETLANDRIIQICGDRVHLISTDMKLLDVLEFVLPGFIVEALVIDNAIILRDQNRKLHLYLYDGSKKLVKKLQKELTVMIMIETFYFVCDLDEEREKPFDI